MTSTIPTVIDGLLSTFRADPALSDAEIIDGQPITGLDRDAILVGDGGEEAAVEVDRGSDLVGQTETYTVMGSIWTWSGSTDAAALRNRAFGYLDAVGASLRADPTLGGAAARLHLTAGDFTQAQTPDGATANLRFGIHVDAFVR